MATATKTAEQQNEQEAKRMLADAINKLRHHAVHLIGDLEDALETLRNVERSLDEVPDGLDAESIGPDALSLSEIAKSVRSAEDEGIEHLHLRSVQDDINRMRDSLSEAVGQVEYLEAGDFSD